MSMQFIAYIMPTLFFITYNGFDIYQVNLNDLYVDFICRTFAVNHYLPLPNFLHLLPTWRLTDRLTPDCLLCISGVRF